MRRFAAVLFACALFAAPAAAKGPLPEPDDGPDARGLTVSGSGVAWVTPPARLTKARIDRAIAAARPAAVRRAVAAARERAAALASAAGLTLGEIVAVRDRDAHAELGYVNQRPVCLSRRCRAPAMTSAAVDVTFATAETATTEGSRAIVAAGVESADVRPRLRRSSASIRAALQRARLAAAPRALREARGDAAALAAAAGQSLGPLLSIAEIRRPQQDLSGWLLGSFGPGQYCGVVRRTIYRRDAGGRRRPVRRVSSRRCFHPFEVDVALRVTYVAA